MRTWIAILAFHIIFMAFAKAESQMPLNLMPRPAEVREGSGILPIGASFSVTTTGYSNAVLERAVARFLSNMRARTGMGPLSMRISDDPAAALVIHTGRAGEEVQELGEDESYSLVVTPTQAKLDAANPLGVLRGLETFLQLVEASPSGFAVPAISIQDRPRFPWRGLMIDVSRHFIPLESLKHNIDGMAAVKMNVLHLHLSDDQGFRIESRSFPKLQQLGSDGLYYTQAEMRDLIAYAADRGIRIVPEFDMPGHSTSWFVGYPELASGKGPYEIDRHWGVRDPAMDPTREETYKFLDVFIGEMSRLFPDRYFHIGGDEVNGKEWDANPRIQEFMRAHGLKDNAALQAYFDKRVQALVSKHGKIMMGWDEILSPDLPKSIVIQSWRGQASLAQAATQGFRGLLSTGYYLDLNQPASEHYRVDPLSGPTAMLTPEQKRLILGGEACEWTEYASAETLDSRIWPRAAPIAERLWSPEGVQDVDSMYRRMEIVSHELDRLGLTQNSAYDSMLRRISGGANLAALRTLADVVEPPKGYSRDTLEATEPTSETPLNRLVDAARPESITARQFAKVVDTFLTPGSGPGTEAQIRYWLTRWSENEIDLRPDLNPSFLLRETAPLSQSLSALGRSGLQALEYLDRGEAPPADWRSKQEALIESAERPSAELILAVAPSIKKLVQAASASAGITPNGQLSPP